MCQETKFRSYNRGFEVILLGVVRISPGKSSGNQALTRCAFMRSDPDWRIILAIRRLDGLLLPTYLAARPGKCPTTKRNLVAHLPWARTIRLQQLHHLLCLLCVFSNLGNLLFAQS